MANISDLVGKIMVNVVNDDNTEIIFFADNGGKWKLYHEQECCEDVFIEDIIGDLSDLVGFPILIAEEICSDDIPRNSDEMSFTWTFYKLATIKGSVTIRWYGTSNGYYSESVNFIEVTL